MANKLASGNATTTMVSSGTWVHIMTARRLASGKCTPKRVRSCAMAAGDGGLGARDTPGALTNTTGTTSAAVAGEEVPNGATPATAAVVADTPAEAATVRPGGIAAVVVASTAARLHPEGIPRAPAT